MAFSLEFPTLAFPHDDPLYSPPMNLNSLTVAQLKEAIAIKEKIESLETGVGINRGNLS